MSTAAPVRPSALPTVEDIGRLALALHDADRAVRDYAGVQGGEEWDAVLATWRDAYSTMQAASAAFRRNEPHG